MYTKYRVITLHQEGPGQFVVEYCGQINNDHHPKFTQKLVKTGNWVLWKLKKFHRKIISCHNTPLTLYTDERCRPLVVFWNSVL